jgi:hypothetical protein
LADYGIIVSPVPFCRTVCEAHENLEMNGPYAPGTCNPVAHSSQWDWEGKHLIRGQQYRVVKPFVDADGDHHLTGEEWVFLMGMFSRFDDELTLCVRLAPGDEWKIPLLWKPEAQQAVIENFLHHVTPVGRA